MIHVHLADRSRASFAGSFAEAYAAAQAYVEAHALKGDEKVEDDRPEGVSESDWRYYCTPSKARIAAVLAGADRPLLTVEVADAARVVRSSASRILALMERFGEARNVASKYKAKWVVA